MAPSVPDLALIIVCGALAGAAAMLLYRWSSNQQRIRDTKTHLAELRARMLSPELSHSEVMQLSMQNLKESLGLLGKVLGPSLLSTAPVLLIAAWLHAEQLQRQFLAFGPEWIRGWEFPYFVSIFIVALTLKLALRIH